MYLHKLHLFVHKTAFNSDLQELSKHIRINDVDSNCLLGR